METHVSPNKTEESKRHAATRLATRGHGSEARPVPTANGLAPNSEDDEDEDEAEAEADGAGHLVINGFAVAQAVMSTP